MNAESSNSRELSPRMRHWVEWGSLWIALTGLALMMQPFTQRLFLPGFWALLTAGIVYVGTTFWRPVGLTRRRAVVVLAMVAGSLAAILALAVLLVPILL